MAGNAILNQEVVPFSHVKSSRPSRPWDYARRGRPPRPKTELGATTLQNQFLVSILSTTHPSCALDTVCGLLTQQAIIGSSPIPSFYQNTGVLPAQSRASSPFLLHLEYRQLEYQQCLLVPSVKTFGLYLVTLTHRLAQHSRDLSHFRIFDRGINGNSWYFRTFLVYSIWR